jgi:hypothetical protein
MQETFEHNISQQLDDFKLQPSPIVWQEVDAALHPERKRRIIIWWWLGAAIIGVSSMLGYWLISNQTSTIAFKEITNNQMNINKAIGTTKNASSIKTKKEIKRPFTIDKEVVIAIEKYQKALLGKSKIKIPIYQQNANINNNRAAKEEFITNSNIQSESADNVVVKGDNSNINHQLITSFEKQNDSNVTSTKSSQNIDTSKTITKDKKASEQSNWLVNVGGGILQTSLNQQTNSLSFSNSASIGSGAVTGVNNNRQPIITSPKTGFNVQLGLAYNTVLGKNWTLQTGLQYQYLTNKQGIKADTTTGFTNSFIADNTNFITNKAHWLKVPITFTYNLQPNSKHQLNILMGSSLAYVVSQEWLISNANTGRFYYNAAANNKWLLGIHGGLSYTLSKKLSLAAMASYTLTPIQSNVKDKNHFVQYNLQLSTPIRFTNKSSSKK